MKDETTTFPRFEVWVIPGAGVYVGKGATLEAALADVAEQLSEAADRNAESGKRLHQVRLQVEGA